MRAINQFLFSVLLIFGAVAQAAPYRTTYQAKIIKPDGQPLQSSSVNFKFSILDPAATCVIYSEDYSAVNMTDTGGVIAFALGAGTRSYPSSGTAATFTNTFDNALPSFPCQGMGVYIPTSNDGRKIVMQFNDGNGWQTLPAMTINAVPYSMFAGKSENSLLLNGKVDTSFVEYSTLAGMNCQANEAIHFNGVSFSCLAVGASATTVTSGSVVTALGYTPANATSFTTLSTSYTSTVVSLNSVSAAVYSVSSTVSSLQGSFTSFQNSVAASFSALAGTGVQSLNGSTSATQTFANGTSGNSPAFVTTNGVHTLNIPYASAATTIAGLISNTDYTNFSNKISSSSVSVIQALGYTPASASALTNYLSIANNLSDLNSVSTARTNLGLGTFATANSVDLGSTSATGTLSPARLPAFSGDVSSASGSPVLALASVGAGVTSGSQYTKVTVDGKGRVTSGAQLAVGDVSTALGYLPASASIYLAGTSAATFSDVELNLKLGYAASTTNTYTQFQAYRPDGYNANITEITGQHVSSLILNSYDHTGYGNNGVYFAKIPFGGTFKTSGTITMAVKNNSTVGIGIVAPQARLHLASSTSSIAPIKFSSGTLLTSPQSGTMEYDGFNYYITDGANVRRTIATGSSAGSIDNASTITATGNITLVPVGSVLVSSTTASTSSTNGAFIVKGGVGIGGDVNIAGNTNVSGTLKATSTITPYIAGSVVASGSLTLDSTTHATKGKVLINPNGGLVGIGTSNPFATLDVMDGSGYLRSNTLDGGLEIGSGNDISSYIDFHGNGNLASDYTGRIEYKDGQGMSLVVSGNALPSFYIQESTGNVGIGPSSSPATKLDVMGDGRFYSSTQNATVNIGRLGDSIYYNALNIFSGYNGTNPSLSLSQDFQGSTLNSYLGSMRFGVGASPSEVMRLTSSGYVGIGTSAPTVPLHILTTGNSNITVQTTASGAGGAAINLVTASTGGSPWQLVKRDDGYLGAPVGSFMINNSSIAPFLITSGGAVGIGTPTPVLKFHVANGAVFSTHSGTDTGVYMSAHTSGYGIVQASNANNTGAKNLVMQQYGGNLGVGGVVTPGAKFEVSNSSSAVVRVLAGTGNGVDDDNLVRLMPQDSVGEGGHLEFKGAANYQDWTVDTVGGDLRIFEPGQSRLTNKTRGGISFVVNSSVTSVPATIDALKLTAAGLVGLGTNTPLRKVHIAYNGSTEVIHESTAVTAATVGRIWRTRLDPANAYFNIDAMNSTLSSGNTIMTMTASGNVGVNVTDPQTQFQLGASNYMGIPANGYQYIPATWRRGNGGGLIFANSQSSDGLTGWAYGSRIINHDYGNGLALSFDALHNGSWINDVLVISGRNGAGYVGMGTALPSEKLHVVGNLRVQGSTDCTLGNGAGGTNCSSDQRLKENIKPIPYALDKVLTLKGVEFDWNQKSQSYGRHDIGVIAQDVEKVFPTAVMDDKGTGYKKVDYAVLVAPLIQAVKEFYAKVMNRFDSQDRKIASLEAENQELKKQNEAIKTYLCSQNPKASICNSSDK